MKKEYNKYFDEMVKENEIKTNYFICVLSFILSLIFIFYILVIDYDADPNGRYMQLFLIVFLIALMFCPLTCLIYRGSKPWLKYMVMISHILTATCGIVFMESGIYVLLMIIPIAASCLYYNPKFTVFVGIASIATLFITALVIDLFAPILYPDLNFMILQDGVNISVNSDINNYLYYYFFHSPIARVPYYIERLRYLIIPEVLLLILVLIICYKITKRARTMIASQADNLRDKIASENDIKLNAAEDDNGIIERNEKGNSYEINHYISPDKTAAGNFYDFFKISDNKIALVIADVAGKGGSASLYMSVCKTILSSSLVAGKSLKDAVNKVNKTLCNSGSDNKYVSCFVGVVDTITGQVEYVNAGSISPAIMRNNNVYEFLDVHRDLFLGAMNDFEYNTYTFKLNNYEKIILCTDGVINEADNTDETFGKKRLLAFLNKYIDLDNELLIKKLVSDVDAFASGSGQDVTVLIYTRKN